MLIVGQDINKIAKFKMKLSKFFAMKDLGSAKQILDMKISRDRKNRKAKPFSFPLVGHFKLMAKQCPISEKEKEEMTKVPYEYAVGGLMYAMICTRLDIVHAVGVVGRFLSNPGK